MSDREQVLQIVNEMPDYKVSGLLGMLRSFLFDIDNNEVPNAVTVAALQEGDEMLRTGKGQHFQGTAEEFFAMLDAEDEEDA